MSELCISLIVRMFAPCLLLPPMLRLAIVVFASPQGGVPCLVDQTYHFLPHRLMCSSVVPFVLLLYQKARLFVHSLGPDKLCAVWS